MVDYTSRSSYVQHFAGIEFAHHNFATLRVAHVSERFLQRRVEIQMDPNLDQRSSGI